MKIKNAEDVFKAPRMGRDTAELRGYQLVEEYFVDSSGFGSANEPALMPARFLEIVKARHIGQHAFITNAGQFQVYVGIFTRGGKRTSRKIANNTYIRAIE